MNYSKGGGWLVLNSYKVFKLSFHPLQFYSTDKLSNFRISWENNIAVHHSNPPIVSWSLQKIYYTVNFHFTGKYKVSGNVLPRLAPSD